MDDSILLVFSLFCSLCISPREDDSITYANAPVRFVKLPCPYPRDRKQTKNKQKHINRRAWLVTLLTVYIALSGL